MAEFSHMDVGLFCECLCFLRNTHGCVWSALVRFGHVVAWFQIVVPINFCVCNLFVALFSVVVVFSCFCSVLSLSQSVFAMQRSCLLCVWFPCVGILFYSIMDSFLLWFYVKLIGWNVSLEQAQMDELLIIVLTFTSMLIICLIIPMLLSGFGILYYTIIEIKEAPSLKEKIKYIGAGKRIQGLERER